MNTDLMFSSNDQSWETPKDFFNKLNYEFNFDIDVCATDITAKCEKYYTIKENALVQNWEGVCYMNPPYGREIKKWIEKAYEESLKGAIVVCLIPARVDTTYWHDFIFTFASEIRFIRGRLKFGDSKNSAPFPSAIIVFNIEAEKQIIRTYNID